MTVLRLAAALLLAASGATAEELVTPIRVGRSDAPIKVTVWAQQDYSHLASRPAIAAIFRDIMEDYARTHPDVQLEISAMPALEMHKAKLLLAASAGRLPDVASVDSFWMPLFLDGGHVQPLDPYWPAEDRADYLPFTIDTLSDAQGHVYGIWHGTDCRLLYYRKDLVPTPPATWGELLDVAARIARERKIAGYLYNAGRWEGSVFDNLAMFWAQGGELVDAAGRPIFGEEPHRRYMVDVLAFLRQTIERGASPLAVLSHNDYQQLTSAAIAGDAAMFLGGNWQLGDLEAGLSPAEFAKWDVAPIPQKNAGTRSTGTGGWVWVMFARDPVRQRAAAEFLQFVESRGNVGRITQATGHLPVRRSVYRDVPFFRDSPWHRKFAEMVVHGKARPAAAAYPAISQQLQIAVGAAVAGDKTPAQAVDDAWRAVQASTARRAGHEAAPRRDWLALVPMFAALALALGVLWPLRGAQGPLRLWLLPAIALSAALIVYPILDLARVALTDTAAYGSPHRYTLESFTSLLAGREFYQMAVITLVFVAASVALQLGLGLAVAVLVDAARRRGARLTLLARAAVVSAWVIPGVLVGVLWRILLVENRSGIVNYYLSLIGLGPLPLLSSAGLAMASVIAANTWRGCAFSMILQFAGLQRIPRELHEAADLEGLRPWARLRMLILPQLAPVLALNLILITIQTLNTFDLVLPLTGGGPARRTEVISLFMYRAAFYDLETGRAAAAAILLLALNIGLAVLASRLILRPRKAA
jgi:multiple sugar transport system substrate-binding protein